MIRTTTTIKGSGIGRGQLLSQIRRVETIVEDANERYATVSVELSGNFDSEGPSSKDKVNATVKVSER